MLPGAWGVMAAGSASSRSAAGCVLLALLQDDGVAAALRASIANQNSLDVVQLPVPSLPAGAAVAPAPTHCDISHEIATGRSYSRLLAQVSCDDRLWFNKLQLIYSPLPKITVCDELKGVGGGHSACSADY